MWWMSLRERNVENLVLKHNILCVFLVYKGNKKNGLVIFVKRKALLDVHDEIN